MMAHPLQSIRIAMNVLYKKENGLALLTTFLFATLLSFGEAFSQNSKPPDMPHPRVGMCSARLG